MAGVQRARALSRRRTSGTHSSSGRASWPSSPATSTSSSRSASRASSSRSPRATRGHRRTGWLPPRSWTQVRDRVLQLQAAHSQTYLHVRDRLADEGIRIVQLRGAPGASPGAAAAIPGRDLPGPDAARGRSLAPLPVHQRPVAVARGDRAGSRARTRSASRASRCRRCCPGCGRWGPEPTCSSSRSSPPTWTRSSRAWTSSITTSSG